MYARMYIDMFFSYECGINENIEEFMLYIQVCQYIFIFIYLYMFGSIYVLIYKFVDMYSIYLLLY